MYCMRLKCMLRLLANTYILSPTFHSFYQASDEGIVDEDDC